MKDTTDPFLNVVFLSVNKGFSILSSQQIRFDPPILALRRVEWTMTTLSTRRLPGAGFGLLVHSIVEKYRGQIKHRS